MGYYLDNINNIYKPCYNKCKKCSGAGDDENNNCLECNDNQDYIFNNGNCLIKSLETTQLETENNDIIELLSTFISNINTIFTEITDSKIEEENKYSYDINSISEEAKTNNSKVYIDIDPETIKFIRKKFSLKEDEKIFLTIIEKNDNNSNSATADYIYQYSLENGTILNMSSIEEDVFIDVYVPITDLELAKFNLTKQFAEQGYDIYDINGEFYNDFCTPASMGENDITLEDRKKDIYPHNITLCKNNCKYNGINIEEQRVICSCNLNSEKNVDEESEIVEDDGNFITYLLDNINYKIFKCYKLFFNFNNLKTSYPFYIILIIFLILLMINFIFICHSLERLKIFLAKEMFGNEVINIDAISETKKLDETQKLNIKKFANPTRKEKEKNIAKNKKDKKNSKDITNNTKSEKNVVICVVDDKLLRKAIKSRASLNVKNINKRKSSKLTKKGSVDELLEKKVTQEKPKKEEEENINELPFSRAIHVDNRNIFHIFYSFLIEKFDLISIICNNYKLKVILFAEYILALLINFFFNSLLYTDDVVSNKYHNNGELDIIVTLTLSIVSNIVSSIFCYYIKYSRGIEDRINLILEIKYRREFYRNIRRLLFYLRIKFVCFFISQLLIIATSMYYIVIFGILYSRSQKSLIVNFCYSLVETIITSFGIALIILITRKIGLSCAIKELYNTSKYINSKF